MTKDIVQELGLLTLGTRLRRLGERLQTQTQVILTQASITTPASQFPLLAAVDQGPLNVGSIAEAIGISQPAVTRQLGHLEAAGLVAQCPSEDQRFRDIALTEAGNALMTHAKHACWSNIEAAVKDACGPNAETLLEALTALETALTTESLHKRAARLQGHSNAPA